MQRNDLEKALNSLLQIDNFQDYCPNGLQVEGKNEINKILCGVTACQALLDEAVRQKVDAVIVHHGYFWKGEPNVLRGIKKQRLQTLLQHNINLFAYHLPLDAHPELGNNAMLGRLFNWTTSQRIGEYGLIHLSELAFPMNPVDIGKMVEKQLGRTPLLVGDLKCQIQKVAWCSGGAQNYLPQAIEAGAHLFISGEISEQTVHLARESGIVYLAAGHHATEKGGINALNNYLTKSLLLESKFIDIDNPV